MAKWRNGYDPHQLAQRIEKAKIASVSGGVSYSGFEHSEHLVLLGGMLELNGEIPDVEKRRILNKATFDAGAEAVVSPDSLRRHASKLESEYFRRPIADFRLLTGISIGRSIKMPTFRINDTNVSINPKLSKSMSRHRAESLAKARDSIAGDPPINYADVSVAVKARSPYEAAQRALDSLDLLRGIWNFWRNRRHSLSISSGQRQPVNSILLAPIHTLHRCDGSPACESWWYEPSYVEPIQPFADKIRIAKMQKFTANFRRHLHKMNYESGIVSSIIRYVRSLDSRDWNDSFLRLWSVLESLTGTKKDSYDVTIRRAAFMYADRDYEFQVLSYLRKYRNSSVHAGSESDEIEALLYLLKRYVEALLNFHVGSSSDFTSMADASEFMDLPSSKRLLDERIKRLKLAKKFVVAP